ncbi:unnamed protein product [Closterium sp. Yama58-4]|nr:unnamed protein product [Closterium sp. Yama58-4]
MQESFEVTSRKPHCLGTRLVHWLGRTVSETEADPQQVSIIVLPMAEAMPGFVPPSRTAVDLVVAARLLVAVVRR